VPIGRQPRQVHGHGFCARRRKLHREVSTVPSPRIGLSSQFLRAHLVPIFKTLGRELRRLRERQGHESIAPSSLRHRHPRRATFCAGGISESFRHTRSRTCATPPAAYIPERTIWLIGRFLRVENSNAKQKTGHGNGCNFMMRPVKFKKHCDCLNFRIEKPVQVAFSLLNRKQNRRLTP